MTTTPRIYEDGQTTIVPRGGGGVVVVERPAETKTGYGGGIAKGMGVVMRHFAKSFTSKSEEKSDQTGMFTVEYPEERMLVPEGYRNMPILLYDDKTGHELCTSCFQCERICPPKVIHITQAKDPVSGKAIPAAEEFVIEYDSCMSCGYCHEICPFDAIKMDHNYELSTPDHHGMDVHKAQLDRPISYYQTIAPNLWADVQANALKKLQNNIKRRSGAIGIAPHMVGKVQKAAAVPTTAAPAASGAAPRSATPVAAVGKSMSPEKLAKLEAIRAAKRGGAAPATEGAIVEPSQHASPEMGSHMAESAAGLAPTAATLAGPAPAATGKNMSPEKLAKLEAIRAAKRAQQGE